MSTQPAAPARDLESTIRTLGSEFGSAFNTGQFDKLSTFYVADATILPPNHEAVGPSKVGNVFREYAEMGATDLKLEAQRVEQFGDLVLEVGRYSFNLKRADGTTTADRGKYVVTWRETQGKWKIYSDIWNSDLPPLHP